MKNIKKKKKNKKTKFYVINYIAFIIALILLIISCFKFLKPQNDIDVPSDPIPIDEEIDFIEDEFMYLEENHGLYSYGSTIVTGYVDLKLKTMDCGNGPCMENNIQSVTDIVRFNVTSATGTEFFKAMSAWGYNDMIPLGCVTDEKITFASFADKYDDSSYKIEIELSSDISKKILASTEDNQVSLKLTKYKFTQNIPITDQCYSPINDIELAE